MSNVTDSYLAHHGILGMRWGHRKIDPFANHQANIQKRAEENGLSKRNAKIIAKKRITAEKVLLVAGGVALGVAAYKFHNSVKNRISDKTMNVMLQRVVGDEGKQENISKVSELLNQPFYAATNHGDKQKYVGLYSHQLKEYSKNVYKMQIKATGLKVASHNSAEKVFSDLYKSDKGFAESVNDVGRMYNFKGIKNYDGSSDPRKIKATYNDFNRSLVLHNSIADKRRTIFYDKMRESGYDAVRDINDEVGSYSANSPIIVINPAKVQLQDVKEISDSEATKAAVAAYTKMTIPSIATYTAVGAGIKLGVTNKYVAKNKKKEASNV
jgi:hypothetical protein